MGHFCLPKDEKTRHELLIRSNLYQRASFIASYDTIIICLGATLGLGLAVTLLTQFCPAFVSYIGIIFGGLASITLGVLVFIRNTY